MSVNGKPEVRRLSPAWWDAQEARRNKHELPAIYIIFNDHQLGWLYNNGKKFSDKKFMAYVHGLAITKGCKEVKFFYGKTILGKKIIKKAVVYYE